MVTFIMTEASGQVRDGDVIQSIRDRSSTASTDARTVAQAKALIAGEEGTSVSLMIVKKASTLENRKI